MPRGEVNHDLVERDYAAGMKYKELAEKYGVTINTVKSWKQRYGWDRKSEKKCAHKNQKSVRTKNDTANTYKEPDKRESDYELSQALAEPLNDNQRLFCEYYAISRNKTQAYIKAYHVDYDSAAASGPRLYGDVRIRAYIDELLRLKRQSIRLEPDDLIELQMRIAWSNMNDYVDYGTYSQPIANDKGEVTGVTYKTFIRLTDSRMVDGGIIKEVKQTQQGISVKLEDRQKAIDWLTDYFEFHPESKYKKEFEDKRLRQEQEKIDLAKQKAKSGLDDTDVQKINESIESLADIINHPVPNRKIEDEGK